MCAKVNAENKVLMFHARILHRLSELVPSCLKQPGDDPDINVEDDARAKRWASGDSSKDLFAGLDQFEPLLAEHAVVATASRQCAPR